MAVRPLWLCAMSVAVALSASSCGGGGQTQLRMLNASPGQPELNLLVDGKTVASNLAYGAASGYISINSGSRQIQIEPAGSSNSIINQTLSFGSDTSSTLVVDNYSANVQSVVFSDDNTAPASGNFRVRVINASPSMGAVDVYVLPAGTSLSGATPLATSLAFGSASDYAGLAAGSPATTYNIYFTQPGTTFSYIVVSTSFTAGDVRTIVALNNLAGGYTTVTLKDVGS
ncbi:MAG TPA: DUF4397 domain-containing protein [Terriglobales bacterium]|nr:DUF4397 domain-containing protein [Terriglobales bacterium]